MRASDRSFGIVPAAVRHAARGLSAAGLIAFSLALLVAVSSVGCAASQSGGEPAPGLTITSPDGSTTRTGEGDPAAPQEGSTTTDAGETTTDAGEPTTTGGDGTTTSITIGEPGERRNPIPMGQQARVGDWMIKVVSADLDATQTVLDENMFNDTPEPGSQYVLVGVEAVYLGGESSTFWVDMIYEFVGSEGGSFEPGTTVAPDSILDEGEVLTGGSVSGNLVFVAASDQVDGGTLMLEHVSALEDTRMFFAVE